MMTMDQCILCPASVPASSPGEVHPVQVSTSILISIVNNIVVMRSTNSKDNKNNDDGSMPAVDQLL